MDAENAREGTVSKIHDVWSEKRLRSLIIDLFDTASPKIYEFGRTSILC